MPQRAATTGQPRPGAGDPSLGKPKPGAKSRGESLCWVSHFNRHVLRLPDKVERVLSSTNQIENLFSRVREIGRRVRRWQRGTMVLRWTAVGVFEPERGIRKIAGYRAIPILVAALCGPDEKIEREANVDDATTSCVRLTLRYSISTAI